MTEPTGTLGIFLSCRRALIKYATGITKDRARAEDVVQEAYLRLHPSLQNASQELRHPTAYLYRIVHNLSLDVSRSESREQRRHESPPEWLIPSELENPESQYLRHAELDHLATALAELPEKTRQALEMHRLGEHTLTQIAEQLQVSPATAHRLVRDALVRLARALPGAEETLRRD